MKYDTAIRLGEGGMGVVYRAYDPRLERHVALKLLHSDEPALVQRLLREARLQARVLHEHVCRVYEVGELDGRPCIAMQYIDGQTLDAAAPAMKLEEKVRVVRDVADAVHAAHRTGLIHRDLKPTNIMVERIEGEGWHPWVLDFGLAREVEAVGLTKTGACLGSPPYMAPEQARGDVHQLDRRTDVYALGAVLYELLTGQPPFTGASPVDVLVKVLGEEPPAPRKLAPRVPVDLETITLRCLEKEPSRRYESARALAEDLERWLDGEPVLARRPGIAARAWRLASRRPRTAVAAVVAVALVGILAGLWLHARWSAAADAALAQQLGQEVERIEATLREAYLLPLHDIRPERDLARLQLRAMAARLPLLGESGRGPGHFALGRGYLALRDYAPARRHLELAWQAGYRTPAVRLALGRAFGGLYGEAIDHMFDVPSAQRAPQRRAVEHTLRDPALAWLRASSGDTEAPASYVRALVAFYEQRYGEALAELRRPMPAGFYLPRVLEGQAELEAGIEKAGGGDDVAALAAYGRAGSAFHAATEIGRSDPLPYYEDCRRHASKLEALLRRNEARQDDVDAGLAACAAAVRADPDAPEAYSASSFLLWRWAEHQQLTGQESSATTTRAIAMAREALRHDPKDLHSLENLATAVWGQAEDAAQNGKDPLPVYEEAIALFHRSLAIDPNSIASLNNLAGAYNELAMVQLARGIDVGPAIDQCVTLEQRAITIEAGITPLWNTMALCHWVRGEELSSRGVDPTPSLELARDAARHALAVNPRSAFAYQALTQADMEAARYELRRGGDPRPLLAHAQENAQHGLAINPQFPHLHATLALVRALAADHLIAHDQDPAAELSAGRRLVDEELQLNAKSTGAFVARADIELMAARWELRRQRSPLRALDDVQRTLSELTAWSVPEAEHHLLAAKAYRWRAEWSRHNRRALDAEAARGIDEARQALALNPRLAEALAVQGALELMRARASASSVVAASAPATPAAPPGMADAERSLGRACELDPLLLREYGPLLAEARAQRRAAG